MRAFDVLTSGRPWAITEDALRQIIQIASTDKETRQAVIAQLGERLANTYSVRMRDGVAIIPVVGPIFRRANMFTEMSGATSIELLARDFQAALTNPEVQAIVLEIDSPGGQANGIHEFAQMIHAARDQKPIVAYVGGMAASAGYWIASAASEIVIDATAELGCIGVIAAMVNTHVPDEIIFTSDQTPNKLPDPSTSAGRAQIQEEVSAMADVFIGDAARNRGITPQTFLKRTEGGRLLPAAAAIEAGLADRVGSLEGVIGELAGGRKRPTQPAIQPARTPAISPYGVHTAASATGGSRQSPERLLSMSEEIRPDVPVPESVAPPAPPDFAAILSAAMQGGQFTEQMTTRFTAMFTEQMQSQIAYAQQQAEAAAARKIAEFQAQQQIQTYAQHVTTPTLQRQYALPIEASAMTAFLSGLNPTQQGQARALFDRILDAGLVSFEEIGSAGDAGDEPTAKERFDALVATKVGTGMSKIAAMQAVAKEQPALYAEYQAESLTPKVAPAARPATKKGAR